MGVTPYRLKYLFAVRNNIAHGKGCFFKVGKDEQAIVKRVLGSLKVGESNEIEVNQYIARALADHIITLIDWIIMH